MLETFLIITTIAPSSNRVLQIFNEDCKKNDLKFIVIGDLKSPSDFYLSNTRYLSLQQQSGLSFKLAKSLPHSKYSRKNLGYLLAMQSGAETIVETDDDNYPMPGFWEERKILQLAKLISGKGWINVYKYFTSENIWPRGFALNSIHNQPLVGMKEIINMYCPIQQGLADENPDVDAIYRLTSILPVKFNKSENISLDIGTWCPFNSQNTTWFRDAFPLLYLPTYCSFRMTDIWRSFIAQRIAWANSWKILFHKATVYQDRNEHNFLKDFEDEIPGYLYNDMICKKLEDLDLKPGKEFIFDNLIKCYNQFIDCQLIDKKEICLIEDWIMDCQSISY